MNQAEAATRSNGATIAAIAVVAYVACDLVHEVLGHGTATLLSPGVEAISLTTVALTTTASSRFVAASGTIANAIAAIVGFGLLRARMGNPSTRYFLWLFATLNLFNATAYLPYSGISDFGDWAVVIAGIEPHLVWRVALVVVGALAYVLSVRISATALLRLVHEGELSASDVGRFARQPYWVGGLLLVAGATLNPISPWLILSSGLTSGFGAMAGLLWVPSSVRDRLAERETPAAPLPLSYEWVIAAIVVELVFVFIIGRGVQLK